MKADDARTPSQRTEAAAALSREEAAAQTLERERRRAEWLAARSGPAGFHTAPVKRAEARPSAAGKPPKSTSEALRKATRQAREKAPRPAAKQAQASRGSVSASAAAGPTSTRNFAQS